MSDWKAQQLRRARQFVPQGTPRAPERSIPGMRRPSGARQGAFGATSTRRGPGPAGARHQQPRQRGRAPLAPSTVERGAHKRVLKVHGAIGVASLADALGLKVHAVLAKLLALGARGLHVNSTLDLDTAALVAAELGWTVENIAVTETELIRRARPEETVTGAVRRAPVVTVMGHVDHGKTSLLDRIRHTSVAAAEAGGITQHIGAYVADTPGGRITFIDTPGHEAFTALRARGAAVTDLVVLVVAADDGIMPQTREAVDHARAAGVPLVVAINKVDRPDADPARVRRQLTEIGLVPEELGGDVLAAEVSAATGQGVPELLEKVLLQAELLPLHATPGRAARGVLVEAALDKSRGPIATVLVKDGTLRVGDVLL
ncbi:MAG TPA: translation initiation factor IF-2 N-terminal domain-containing protein, partial [Polyangiaceae bacterium]|nr:translation initiation factor IF-2 N-terminal domain-containing protein [Polyangiaceae bacterium]